jgi:hypothetical protein
MIEGNLLSFRIFIDKKGKVVTELSGLPENKINTVFKDEYTRSYIRTILREGHSKLDGLHAHLENQIGAL